MTSEQAPKVTQADRDQLSNYLLNRCDWRRAELAKAGKLDTEAYFFAAHRTKAERASPPATDTALVEALEAAERAIAEYYRYWTGGETRGSYDGKPERQGLWEAQRKARAALTSARAGV